MIVGGDGHHPYLVGQLGKKVAAVEGGGLHPFFDTLLLAAGVGTGLAQTVELVNVQLYGDVAIPDIGTLPAEDQGMPRPLSQGVQGSPDPMEHGLQGVEGIDAASLTAPQQFYQFIGGGGAAPAVDHVSQQKPDLFGPIISVIDPHGAVLEGKFSQHTHFDGFLRQKYHLFRPFCNSLLPDRQGKVKCITFKIPQNSCFCNSKSQKTGKNMNVTNKRQKRKKYSKNTFLFLLSMLYW